METQEHQKADATISIRLILGLSILVMIAYGVFFSSPDFYPLSDKLLDEARIKSTISEVRPDRVGLVIRVIGIESKLQIGFYSNSELPDSISNPFLFLRVGDSIIKEQYTDSVKIVHGASSASYKILWLGDSLVKRGLLE